MDVITEGSREGGRSNTNTTNNDNGGSTTLDASGRSSSGNSSSNNINNSAAEEVKNLTVDDTKHVRRWKFLLVAIITCAGALVSMGIKTYLEIQERQEVEHSVSVTERVVSCLVARLHRLVGGHGRNKF